MNFNKNNKRNKEGGNRFGDLQVEKENPFMKNSRGSNKNRSRDRDNSSRKSKSSFGSSQKGSYVPPSQRKKKERKSRFKEDKEPEKPKNVIPDVHNAELFPSLGDMPSNKNEIVSEDTVTKEEPKLEPNVENKTQEKVVDSAKKAEKPKWSSVLKYQAPEVTEESPEYIPPGWVRIAYDKELKEFVHTYGPESEEYLEFKTRMEAYKRQKAIEEWDKRMQEYEEYDELMGYSDNYYYSWQAEEVEAERRLEEKIAQMELELENGTYWDDTPDSDEESEFYEDEY